MAVEQQGAGEFVGGCKSDPAIYNRHCHISATPIADTRTILSLVALGSAVATTIGRMIGIGPFGFMHGNPMVWVGLIQAYLLMTIIAVLLILGARHANTRKWHVVGAVAHGPPLIAAFSSLDLFASMGVFSIVWIPITFHMVFLSLETFAALYFQRR